MKKALLILMFCCLLGAALAETAPTETPLVEAAPTPTPLESSANNFFTSLGQTWDAFLGMSKEVNNVMNDWAAEVQKLSDEFMAKNLPELKAWLDEAAAYFDKEVSPEIDAAFKTLLDGAAEAGAHTREELNSAYQTLSEYLKENNADPSVVEAVDSLANLAGLTVPEKK